MGAGIVLPAWQRGDAPLAVPTPSARASGLGVAASPGRRRPGCATGRAETRPTAHHPSSDRAKESRFLSWYGKHPSARPGTQPPTASQSGVDSTRRGKAPPLAGFRPFCPVKMDPSGARPPCQAGMVKPAPYGEVNPSVSLAADSSLYTREPLAGNSLPLWSQRKKQKQGGSLGFLLVFVGFRLCAPLF